MTYIAIKPTGVTEIDSHLLIDTIMGHKASAKIYCPTGRLLATAQPYDYFSLTNSYGQTKEFEFVPKGKTDATAGRVTIYFASDDSPQNMARRVRNAIFDIEKTFGQMLASSTNQCISAATGQTGRVETGGMLAASFSMISSVYGLNIIRVGHDAAPGISTINFYYNGGNSYVRYTPADGVIGPITYISSATQWIGDNIGVLAFAGGSGGAIGPNTVTLQFDKSKLPTDDATMVFNVINCPLWDCKITRAVLIYQGQYGTVGNKINLADHIAKRGLMCARNTVYPGHSGTPYTITITANGTPMTLTSGIDFVMGTNDTTDRLITANNIAAAINANLVLSSLVTATVNSTLINDTRTFTTGYEVILIKKSGCNTLTIRSSDYVNFPWYDSFELTDFTGGVDSVAQPDDEVFIDDKNADGVFTPWAWGLPEFEQIGIWGKRDGVVKCTSFEAQQFIARTWLNSRTYVWEQALDICQRIKIIGAKKEDGRPSTIVRNVFGDNGNNLLFKRCEWVISGQFSTIENIRFENWSSATDYHFVQMPFATYKSTYSMGVAPINSFHPFKMKNCETYKCEDLVNITVDHRITYDNIVGNNPDVADFSNPYYSEVEDCKQICAGTGQFALLGHIFSSGVRVKNCNVQTNGWIVFQNGGYVQPNYPSNNYWDPGSTGGQTVVSTTTDYNIAFHRDIEFSGCNFDIGLLQPEASEYSKEFYVGLANNINTFGTPVENIVFRGNTVQLWDTTNQQATYLRAGLGTKINNGVISSSLGNYCKNVQFIENNIKDCFAPILFQNEIPSISGSYIRGNSKHVVIDNVISDCVYGKSQHAWGSGITANESLNDSVIINNDFTISGYPGVDGVPVSGSSLDYVCVSLPASGSMIEGSHNNLVKEVGKLPPGTGKVSYQILDMGEDNRIIGMPANEISVGMRSVGNNETLMSLVGNVQEIKDFEDS